MPSVSIKCTANMAHSCASIQSCTEHTRGPSYQMTWRASRLLLPDAQPEKTKRKWTSAQVPERVESNFSPMESGYHLQASKQALHGGKGATLSSWRSNTALVLDNIGLSEFLLQITAPRVSVFSLIVSADKEGPSRALWTILSCLRCGSRGNRIRKTVSKVNVNKGKSEVFHDSSYNTMEPQF